MEIAQSGSKIDSNTTTSTKRTRRSRNQNRFGNIQPIKNRDFERSTPKIGGFIALSSENITKKVNYDIFCEKLAIYAMRNSRTAMLSLRLLKPLTWM